MRVLPALLVSTISRYTVASDGIEVDLELVLLVDVSRLMSDNHLGARRGSAAPIGT